MKAEGGRRPWRAACAGSALLLVQGAWAAPAALDPDFLTYLEQYADARGNVFDARDLAATPAPAMPPGQTGAVPPDHSSAPPVPEKKP